MGVSAVLGWYLLFAATTAFTAMYELFIPVLREYAALEPEDNLVQYKYISYFSMFLLSLITAPLILPIALIPSLSVWFKKALLDNLVATPAKI